MVGLELGGHERAALQWLEANQPDLLAMLDHEREACGYQCWEDTDGSGLISKFMLKHGFYRVADDEVGKEQTNSETEARDDAITMNDEERLFIDKTWPQLSEWAEKHWGDSEELHLILAELKYRSRKGAVELRERISKRLVELSKKTFLWPSTAVVDSQNALQGDQFWYERGVLSFLGYKVGQKGVREKARQEILDYAFHERLPNVNSSQYMEEWGKPATANRLKKLADCLATFARNAKRNQTADIEQAVAEWEADLRYLECRYYRGHFDFSWPVTH